MTLFEAPGGEYFWLVSRQGLHEMAVLADLPVMIHADDVFHVRWLQTYKPGWVWHQNREETEAENHA